MTHFSQRHVFHWAVWWGACLSFLVLACGTDAPSMELQPSFENWETKNQQKKIDKSKVLATVDGVPIYPEDVRVHVQQSKKRITKEEALEELIQLHLLTQEAKKHGYAKNRRVVAEYKKMMALKFLEKKGREFTTRSLSPSLLQKTYEQQKSRFVHGPLRKVIHGLVETGKGKHTESDAKKIGEKIRRAVKNVQSEENFRKEVQGVTEGTPHFRIEDLPPFDANNKGFVKPFVDGTFAIQFPKERTSKPIQTRFGIHIIYIQSEEPAKDVTFEQARAILEKELIDPERQKFITNLIDDLYEKGDIFIYDKNILTANTGTAK